MKFCMMEVVAELIRCANFSSHRFGCFGRVGPILPLSIDLRFSLSEYVMLCVISALCSIEAQAYGGNVDGHPRYAYVKLNGVAVWQASWYGEYPNNRGVNVVIVDLASCTMHEWHNFDTYVDRAAAARLRDYIRGLNDGTVLVGVSCDSAETYLSDAFATLSALGADVSDVRQRGAWAFVAVKGDPSKTVFDKKLTEATANANQPRVNADFCKCDQS